MGFIQQLFKNLSSEIQNNAGSAELHTFHTSVQSYMLNVHKISATPNQISTQVDATFLEINKQSKNAISKPSHTASAILAQVIENIITTHGEQSQSEFKRYTIAPNDSAYQGMLTAFENYFRARFPNTTNSKQIEDSGISSQSESDNEKISDTAKPEQPAPVTAIIAPAPQLDIKKPQPEVVQTSQNANHQRKSEFILAPQKAADKGLNRSSSESDSSMQFKQKPAKPKKSRKPQTPLQKSSSTSSFESLSNAEQKQEASRKRKKPPKLKQYKRKKEEGAIERSDDSSDLTSSSSVSYDSLLGTSLTHSDVPTDSETSNNQTTGYTTTDSETSLALTNSQLSGCTATEAEIASDSASSQISTPTYRSSATNSTVTTSSTTTTSEYKAPHVQKQPKAEKSLIKKSHIKKPKSSVILDGQTTPVPLKITSSAPTPTAAPNATSAINLQPKEIKADPIKPKKNLTERNTKIAAP